MEQEIFYKVSDLKLITDKLSKKDIFLVAGKKSYELSGAKQFIKENIDYDVLFNDFDVNPKLTDLKKGINLFNKGNYKLIVAIGGGSILDMAKLISIMAHQNADIENLVKNQTLIKDVKTPVLAIPTTAGTGAEATQFAVLYINKTKYSVLHKSIKPDYVYLSAEFLKSASPYLTATTGADAFCQAVESVWSVNATKQSEKYALEAIELIWHNLENAVKSNQIEAKQQMMQASFLAGKAINISKTTAPHAISYTFTSYYNIPHGHAVALSLPFFVKFNYFVSNDDCTNKNGADFVKSKIDKILNILGVDIENAEQELKKFFQNIGLEMNLNKLTKNFDSNLLIENVNTERLNNNPRKVTKEVLLELINTIKI